MTSSIAAPASLSHSPIRSGRLGGICLALGGVAFLAGGVIHPGDDGGDNKVEQLYQAFVQPSWYPSHALLLASFGLFAAAVLLLRERRDLGSGMARLARAVGVVAVVATLGMAVHLLSALGAGSIADGQPSLVSHVATWNETIVSTLWGLGIIALAVGGGLTRSLGNRVTMSLAVVGGLAWSIATATIAFTDRFDPLFPIAGSLISVWAVAAGTMWAVRDPRETTRRMSPPAAAASIAADPLTLGRCAYAQAARWMPYVDHDVLEAATRTAWWPRWLEIATAEPTTLGAPGDSADGTLLTSARPVQVRWTVTRRLRDVVTLEATRDGDLVASLNISFSRWHDGCIAELRLTSTAGSSRRLRRALQRSLNDLGAAVDPVGTAIPPNAGDAPAGRAREVIIGRR